MLYWWWVIILMQFMCKSWQCYHEEILVDEVEEWFDCVCDNVGDTLFVRLWETQCLACIVLGDCSDNPRLIQFGLLTCTLDGQTIDIHVC